MFARAATTTARIGSLRVSGALKARAFSTISSTAKTSPANWAAGAAVVVGTVAAYSYWQGAPLPTLAADTKPIAGVKGSLSERTFIAVKPDGVQRGLVGKIISRFEDRGFKLVAIKSVVPSRGLAEKHYADLKGRPFFPALVEYMTNGKAPVVAMVWEGMDVIRQSRLMIGATNPADAAPGSIRGMYCVSIGRNIIHGSDSYDTASKEIGLWFGKAGDLTEWEPASWSWVMASN